MQYYCSHCRRPLKTGQSMCSCGQFFDPVSPYDPNSLSNYWPPAAKSAGSRLWDGIPNAAKSVVGGLVALVTLTWAIGGSVLHYQALQARYAPGHSVMVASVAKPTPMPSSAANISKAPPAPATPPPMVLMRPVFVPPTYAMQSSSQSTAGTASDTPAAVPFNSPDTPDQAKALKSYGTASSDVQDVAYGLESEYETGFTPMPRSYVFITIYSGIARMRRDREIMKEQFERMSPMDATTMHSLYADTFTDQYIAKWQAKLNSLPPPDAAEGLSIQ